MDDSSIRPSTPTVAVETSVSRVTFFEDRAEVMRVARCSVPRGRSRVQAHGITLLVDDRSLTCGTGGTEKVEIVFSRIRTSPARPSRSSRRSRPISNVRGSGSRVPTAGSGRREQTVSA